MTATDTHRAIDAVWRIESPRLIAGLARIVRDIGLAEDLAQDALVAALEQWPQSGVPDKPGAWLMATAKHRAIDFFRRNQRLARKHETARAAIPEPVVDESGRPVGLLAFGSTDFAIAEARDLKATLTADIRRGEYRAVSRIRFSDYAREWVTSYQGRTANGIRPEISEVVAASPNHRLPQRAPGPKWARASGSKIAAAATEEIAPTTSGPSSQASGGNSTL